MKEKLIIATHTKSGLYICISGITYGIEDKIKWFVYHPLSRTITSKLRYDGNGDSYFLAYNKKIYLNECIKYDYAIHYSR